jgi:hypothetical protein
MTLNWSAGSSLSVPSSLGVSDSRVASASSACWKKCRALASMISCGAMPLALAFSAISRFLMVSAPFGRPRGRPVFGVIFPIIPELKMRAGSRGYA